MKCPQCFNVLPPGVFTYLCAGTCDLIVSGAASDVRGYAVETPPLMRGSEVGATCERCSSSTTQQACAACAFPLPPGYRDAAVVTCIALAGARATGKSMMIGSQRSSSTCSSNDTTEVLSVASPIRTRSLGETTRVRFTVTGRSFSRRPRWCRRIL